MTHTEKSLKRIEILLEAIAVKLGAEIPTKPTTGWGEVSVLKTTFGVMTEGSEDVPTALTEEQRQVMAAQESDKRLKQGERRVDRQPVEERGTR